MNVSFIVKLFSKSCHHNFDEQGNSDCTPLDGALQTLFYSCFECYFRLNQRILSKKQVCPLLYFCALPLLWISAVIFPPCPGPKLCAFKHAVYFRISNNCFCFFLYASPVFVSVAFLSVSVSLAFCGVSPFFDLLLLLLWRCRWRYLAASLCCLRWASLLFLSLIHIWRCRRRG